MEWWGCILEPDEILPVKPKINELIHLSEVSIPLEDVEPGEYVRVYVRVDSVEHLIAILTRKTPRCQLGVVFGRQFILSHESSSGSVQFLGYSANPEMLISLSNRNQAQGLFHKQQIPSRAQSPMKWWGCILEPYEILPVTPKINELINISEVSIPMEDVEPGIYVRVHVTVDGEKHLIAILTRKTPRCQLGLVFERQFILSHESSNGSVQFLGYSTNPKKAHPLNKLKEAYAKQSQSSTGTLSQAGKEPQQSC